jgi:hypothetical protein
MKKKKTNTLSFANGMTFDLVSKGKRFLGLGRIRCGDVKLRSGRLPMFVDISTPYGETLLDYELKATDVGARKIVLTFGAKVTEGSFMEWQVHECRRMRTIHDWSKGPQESDVELKLVLKPASRTLNGVKFKGFSYQYTYRSATLPIYMILDRGSWEPGGKAVGNEFWWRSCFSTPVVRFETASQRYASEWYLPDCANPNVFQFVPMQTEGQGLIFTTGCLAPSQVRNTCCFGEGRTAVRFTRDTMPNAFQARAFQLLEADHACWRYNKAVPSRRNGKMTREGA